MPFVSNATFLFTPCVGGFIDARGFAQAAQGLGAALVSAVLALRPGVESYVRVGGHRIFMDFHIFSSNFNGVHRF